MSIWSRLVWDMSRNVCVLVSQRVQVHHKPQMKAEDLVITESARFEEKYLYHECESSHKSIKA